MGERGENERTNAQEERERDSGRLSPRPDAAAAAGEDEESIFRVRTAQAAARSPRKREGGRGRERAGRRGDGCGVARQTATDRTQKILRRRRRRELNGQEGGTRTAAAPAKFGGQAGLDLDS